MATVTYTTTTNWGYGLQADVAITPSVTVTQWTLEFDAADQQTLTFAMYAGSTQTGRHVTLTNRPFNGTILAGSTLHVAVQFSNPTFTDVPPSGFVVNGQAAAYTPSPYIVVSADKPTVPEGGSATVSVKLSQAPTENSVITVGSGSASPIRATPSQLTFTPTDWDAPRTVTLTSPADADTTNQSTYIWLQQQTGRPFYATDVLFATQLDDGNGTSAGVTAGARAAKAANGAKTDVQAATPLPAPTGLQALHIADTTADLTWLGSGLSAGDIVERQVDGVWQRYAGGAFGSLALANLTPATTYTFRVYSVPVQGLGYTDSAPCAPVSFTTLSGPDTVPPTKPATPLFSGTTTTGTTVSWAESTDNVQVTGYSMQQLVAGAWTTIRTVDAAARFQSISGLSPGTAYTFSVIAFDAKGNASARSDPGTVTTAADTAAPSCRVQVQAYNPGFTAIVTIVNTTAAPLSGWTIRFTLPATATVSTTFNGVLKRDGAVGTITPQSWNTVIGAGGQAYPGFTGSAAPFTPPSAFTLNGRPCTSG
ncbi:MAG: cellulose binding domain-containing protein [Catenulispora sp.]